MTLSIFFTPGQVCLGMVLWDGQAYNLCRQAANVACWCCRFKKQQKQKGKRSITAFLRNTPQPTVGARCYNLISNSKTEGRPEEDRNLGGATVNAPGAKLAISLILILLCWVILGWRVVMGTASILFLIFMVVGIVLMVIDSDRNTHST